MWKPVETEFDVPQFPVGIVHISGNGAEFTRLLLEDSFCVVRLFSIGTPSDLLKVLSLGEDAPRYMILMGHGDSDGIVFPEYAPDITDISMLRNGCLPPEVIGRHVDLPGCTVISYSCEGGFEAMGQAFVAGKVAAYIGCRTSPGSMMALNLFLLHFLFGAMQKKLSDRDAWHRALTAIDDDTIREFNFFHGDGREEKFEQTTSR